MWGCNSLIWISLVAFIIGIGLLITKKVRKASESDGSVINMGKIGGGFIILSVLLAVTSSYLRCDLTVVGTCPTTIAIGSGYVCTNEGGGCFGIIPGKCKTVAGSFFWESACECDCV